MSPSRIHFPSIDFGHTGPSRTCGNRNLAAALWQCNYLILHIWFSFMANLSTGLVRQATYSFDMTPWFLAAIFQNENNLISWRMKLLRAVVTLPHSQVDSQWLMLSASRGGGDACICMMVLSTGFVCSSLSTSIPHLFPQE